MIFKDFKAEDEKMLNKYLKRAGENSCETTFVNLLIWSSLYKMQYAVYDDMLFIKSQYNGEDLFYLPIGNDLKKGINEIIKYANCETPTFWAQSGKEFDEFKMLFGEKYDITESADEADYIYLRENLAVLSGKKYHSKRNHISAFSKKYGWQYEKADKNNAEEIKLCAKLWYGENKERLDSQMETEENYINSLIDNMEKIGLFGGAIRAEGKIVAFTLASEINEETVDIHIEKALGGYAEAYTVINKEFALRELSKYKYINREDDLGLAGLRNAKQSYHPEFMLKKYLCTDKKTADIKRIYYDAFGKCEEFDGTFFANFLNYNRTLTENGKTVSVLFKIPCFINGKKVYYIYAAATDKNLRGKGYMSKLLLKVQSESDAPLFLKPESEELVAFYEKRGFYTAKVKEDGDTEIVVSQKHKKLSSVSKNSEKEFVIMFSDKDLANGTYRFFDTME